jgi:hypothetical protein
MISRRLLFSTALLLLSVAAAFSQKNPRQETIVGTIIDIVSYLESGSQTVQSGGALNGAPLGILESKSGKVYYVVMAKANTSANPMLLTFIGQRVAARGFVYRKGGCQLLELTAVSRAKG